MRTGQLICGFTITALCFLASCGSGPPNAPLWEQIGIINTEKNELQMQVKQLEEQNAQLHEENQALLSIEKADHLAAMDRLKRIAIRDRSGFYDKNKDGTSESLVIYLETIDSAEDRIKAPGQVQVELWDLNRPEIQARIGQWTVKPEELKTLWASTIMTNYYRLVFPVGDQLTGSEKELTVKILFIDILTGKTLRDQYVFEP